MNFIKKAVLNTFYFLVGLVILGGLWVLFGMGPKVIVEFLKGGC